MPFKGKLTEEQARAIHADRRSYGIIAKQYGIASMTVSHIKQGKTWKKLKLPPAGGYKSLGDYERERDSKSIGDDSDTGRGQAANTD